jgi:hypothetical protein
MANTESLFPKSLHEIVFKTIVGAEGFEGSVYVDSVGVPTIGYGTALVINGHEGWQVLTKLYDRLVEAGVKLDSVRFERDHDTLEAIAKALNDKSKTKNERQAKAKRLFRGHTFSFSVTEELAKKLWLTGMEKDILPYLKAPLNNEGTEKKKRAGKKGTYEKLQGSSREFAALADAAYNAPGLISQELVGYIVRNERQKAFYYIGYKMRAHLNYSKNPGYVARSYKEAYQYGYTDADKPTEEEIRAMEQIYNEHKNEIDAYDKKWKARLKKEIPAWTPFADLIKSAQAGKVIEWAPGSQHKKGTKQPGVSPEQLSLMMQFYLAHAGLTQPGCSAYEQIMTRYTGAGSDFPSRNICDPYRDIRRRYGDE